MLTALLTALLQVATVQSVPSISMDVDGRSTTLDSRVVSDSKSSILVVYSKPLNTIPMTVVDGTDGVLDTTIPTISFDQPLAVRNERTGLITVYPTVVMHRTPTVVVKGADSAGSAYRIVPNESDGAEVAAGSAKDAK